MREEEIHRMKTRPWKIVCRRGSFVTYPLTKYHAEEVARWCDRVHRGCGPHTVIVRLVGSGRIKRG